MCERVAFSVKFVPKYFILFYIFKETTFVAASFGTGSNILSSSLSFFLSGFLSAPPIHFRVSAMCQVVRCWAQVKSMLKTLL